MATQNLSYSKTSEGIQNSSSRKTMTIDTRYKEMYYQAEPAIKESKIALQHQHVFWNYMMHVSMQNTIVQMSKAS